jgi:hypothetical protein
LQVSGRIQIDGEITHVNYDLMQGVQIGEEAMLYLLSHATIFVPLPHHCLLQVAGHAVSMVAFDSKQTGCTSWSKQQQISAVEQGEDLIFQDKEMAGLVVNMVRPAINGNIHPTLHACA